MKSRSIETFFLVLIYLCFSFLSVKQTLAQLVVKDYLVISAATIVNVDGDINATGGNIDFSGAGSEIQVSGTLSSFGDIDASNGTITLNGTSTQTLSESETFYNLRIANSNDVNLGAATNVNGTLTLGDGDLITNANTLTLKSSTSGGTNSGHVVGRVHLETSSTSEFHLDVGNGASRHPVKLQIKDLPGQTITLSSMYVSGGPNGIDWNTYPEGQSINGATGLAHVNNSYYYDITCSPVVPTYVSLPLSGMNPSLNVAEACLAHFNTGSGSWEMINAYSVPSSMTDYVKGLATSFSPFGQGSSGDALPVELDYFTADCADEIGALQWRTFSEVNNDFFILERSVLGDLYTEVAVIPGNGTTSSPSKYSWFDEDVPVGRSIYYLLRQVDYDLNEKVYGPIVLNSCNTASYFNVYVDNNSIVNCIVNVPHSMEVYGKLLDINGKEIAVMNHLKLNQGDNLIQLPLSYNLSAGVYNFQLIAQDQIFSKNILISKK